MSPGFDLTKYCLNMREFPVQCTACVREQINFTSLSYESVLIEATKEELRDDFINLMTVCVQCAILYQEKLNSSTYGLFSLLRN